MELDIYPHKRILFSISGGTDSALLLYLVCKHITENNLTDIIITPWTVVDIHRPGNEKIVQIILDMIISFYPNINLKPLLVDYIDVKMNNSSSKLTLMRNINKQQFRSGQYDMLMFALTNSPPVELSAPLETPEDRNPNTVKLEKEYLSEYNVTLYGPFVNVNKKGIAHLYEKHNLMDLLFPITQSCIGLPEETDNGTKPCKKCFWCLEKFWAFGRYDFNQ